MATDRSDKYIYEVVERPNQEPIYERFFIRKEVDCNTYSWHMGSVDDKHFGALVKVIYNVTYPEAREVYESLMKARTYLVCA